ncbi:MAG: cell division protein ZapA [Clostridia bacterium]|nr:cell division protein ZapA [Clostridia bacterium]
MKQSYNIELAGVNLNIVTEDGADFVKDTVAEVEASVQNMLRVGKNFSKLDAALLSALDYCGEFRKAEAKIRNLEAQIEILEAGRRMRGDDRDETAEDVPAVEEIAEEIEEIEETEEAVEAAPVDEADEGSRDEKFRQLEALLGSQLKFDLGND